MRAINTIALQAESRQPGKSTARAIRRAGGVPCALYGYDVDPVSFSTTEKSLSPLIYTTEAHRVEVSLGKNKWDCILKDMAFHPVTDRPMHADFLVLHPGRPVTLTVPVRYVGNAIGQAQGGRVQYTVTELAISSLPKNIPACIDVDITDIEIGDSIHVRDLEVEDIEILAPQEQILMSIVRPRAVVVEEEEEEEETEDAEALEEQ